MDLFSVDKSHRQQLYEINENMFIMDIWNIIFDYFYDIELKIETSLTLREEDMKNIVVCEDMIITNETNNIKVYDKYKLSCKHTFELPIVSEFENTTGYNFERVAYKNYTCCSENDVYVYSRYEDRDVLHRINLYTGYSNTFNIANGDRYDKKMLNGCGISLSFYNGNLYYLNKLEPKMFTSKNEKKYCVMEINTKFDIMKSFEIVKSIEIDAIDNKSPKIYFTDNKMFIIMHTKNIIKTIIYNIEPTIFAKIKIDDNIINYDDEKLNFYRAKDVIKKVISTEIKCICVQENMKYVYYKYRKKRICFNC